MHQGLLLNRDAVNKRAVKGIQVANHEITGISFYQTVAAGNRTVAERDAAGRLTSDGDLVLFQGKSAAL